MPQQHSRTVPGGRAFYQTERLWKLAEGLPVEPVPIDAVRFQVDPDPDYFKWDAST